MDERYLVMPAELLPTGQHQWTVSDRKEMRHICWCTTENDAKMIAGCLNQAELES